MKLFKVPPGSMIRVIGEVEIPPAAPEIDKGEILKFIHVDGMYSLCVNKSGKPVHLVAWAEVEVI